MCITADGQNYVVTNRMIPFVIDALMHPSLLLPRTKGLTAETTTKCGRILMQMAKECEAMRQPVRSTIVSNLTNISAECRRLWKALPAQDESTLNSPRMQILQRLTNLCAVVESMGTETRRHTSEFLKDVFTEGVIEALVRAYPCSLPPARQLFVQLSMRHTGNTSSHFGYCPAAKAVTSVLKLAASIAPTLLLPVLFKVVDETLGLISASKTALRAFSVRVVADQHHRGRRHPDDGLEPGVRGEQRLANRAEQTDRRRHTKNLHQRHRTQPFRSETELDHRIRNER